MLAEFRRADGAQHASGSRVAARGGGEELAGGMLVIALVGEALQFLDLAAVIAWCQVHFGQLRLAGAPSVEEAVFQAVRPGEGIEHADLPCHCGYGAVDCGERGSHHGTSGHRLSA
ncbi:hypothetical protein D3C78_683420 [compost metagenome]